MSIPGDLREELRELLWCEADRIGWMSLPTATKSQCYSNWVRDPAIGGKLARYMAGSEVRVYLKDSLLKSYCIERLRDHRRPFRVLGISEDTAVAKRYVKPAGCRLADGRIVCWSRATEWKTTMMAVYERGFGGEPEKHGVVFFGACGAYAEGSVRRMVEEAGRRLGVSNVKWLEM